MSASRTEVDIIILSYASNETLKLLTQQTVDTVIASENAALGTPILPFSETGGIPLEFNKLSGGIDVPYGDLVEMTNQIYTFSQNPSMVKKMGYEALQWSKEFDVQVQAPKLLKIIKNI